MIKSLTIRNTNSELYHSQLFNRLDNKVLLMEFDANIRRVSIWCQDEKGALSWIVYQQVSSALEDKGSDSIASETSVTSPQIISAGM